MTPDMFAASLRALLAALRDDLKPALTDTNARARADVADMLLTRLSIEATVPPAPDVPVPETTEEIAAFARAEAERRNAIEDAVAAAATAPPAGRRSGGELAAIPPDRFTAYLRRRFPGDPDIRATRFETLPGGRSKGTIIVDIEGRSTPSTIVLRRDFELSVTGTSVVDEYPILSAAYAAGVPAPPPLWLERDPEAIGGPFIAFEKVAGKAMGTLFVTEATPGVLTGLASALARLHAIDIDAAGLADTLDFARAPDPVAAMLDSLWHRYQTRAPHLPLVEAAFRWLRLRIGTLGSPRRLVHGDASVHNLMGDGDRLTALLDWEFAHAGDPAEDLTFCRPLVERTIPWADFMAAYHAAGGAEISAERLHVFAVYRAVQLAVFASGARFVFEKGADQDLRLATIAYNSLPRHLRELATTLANA